MCLYKFSKYQFTLYINVKIIDQLSVSVTWDMVDMLHDMMYGEGLYLPINRITVSRVIV